MRSESTRGRTNLAFQVGIAKCEKDLFDNFRCSSKSKSLEMTNIDVPGVCAKYDMEEGKTKTLPLLIKGMVKRMIEEDKLKAHLQKQDVLYAIGECNKLIRNYEITCVHRGVAISCEHRDSEDGFRGL